MCGVPYHAADGYISRLLQRGYRVAICEQMEDPKFAKKLVKREVTRVLTPGTAMDANLVRPRENNFLAAVARVDGRAGLAHVDVSTGEFRVTELEPAEVAGAIEHLGAREVLFPGDLPLAAAEDRSGPRFVRTEVEEWVFTPDYADRSLRDHFKLLTLDGCGLANRPAAVGAAGAILHYLRETQRASLDHLDRPAFYNRADSMVLDAVTVRNLELIEPVFAADAHQQQATLLNVLDQTQTGMGGRLLRQRLLRPSMDRAEIEQRLDAVGELLQQTILRAELRQRAGRDSRPRTSARQSHAGNRRTARRSGAGAIDRKDSGAEAVLRYATGAAFAHAARSSGRTARCREPDSRSDFGRAAAQPRGRRDDSRRVSTPISMNCAISARTESNTSRRLRRASGSARAFNRSRCASTTSSDTTSRSRAPTSILRPRITSASRRWPTRSASPRPS